jgi:hypothetical protein
MRFLAFLVFSYKGNFFSFLDCLLRLNNQRKLETAFEAVENQAPHSDCDL